eukprot:764312-Hanusia_phi.AAC.2
MGTSNITGKLRSTCMLFSLSSSSRWKGMASMDQRSLSEPCCAARLLQLQGLRSSNVREGGYGASHARTRGRRKEEEDERRTCAAEGQ